MYEIMANLEEINAELRGKITRLESKIVSLNKENKEVNERLNECCNSKEKLTRKIKKLLCERIKLGLKNA